MANDSQNPKDKESKRDLTGIIDLQRLQAENPETMAEVPVDPFAVNELAPVEQVDHFDSIDQIGMMDHPSDEEREAAELAASTESTDDFPISSETSFEDQPFEVAAPSHQEAGTSFEHSLTQETLNNDFAAPTNFSSDTPADFGTNDFGAPTLSEPVAPAPMAEVRAYSEKSQGRTNLEIKIHYPFHLKIQGTFGPFERDKLLIFITENPIGLNSGDLDLQLQAGRVLLPRISEFAAIKLVQELRDSGLAFQLHPSDRDADDSVSMAPALSYHYENASSQTSTALSEIRILSEGNFNEIDQVSMVQFVKTEMVEVENSPVIQEVIERMTEALKQKARLKGGNALLHLQKEISPLRLPSQYQISLKASVIKI